MNNSTAPAPVGNANYDYGNQDPNNIQTDEVINAVFVIDKSISISNYVQDLNKAFNDFKTEMAGSHVGSKLFASIVEFHTKVVSRGGFQPIGSIADQDFGQNLGGSTALYDAVLDGLTNALNYRTSLESSGINVKTLLFVITDGADNNSNSSSAGQVKKMIEDLAKEERSFGSFTSVLFGVGNDRPTFEGAQRDMGITHLGVVGNSAQDIRKMINFISSSISSTNSGIAISSPNF